MSQFYQPNKPFSIDNWNGLIRAVNEVLQNPEGNCDPVDTVPEVMAPHKWSKDDIELVRERLIETCDSISFSQPLRLWSRQVVDEIESAMNEAWCDCDCDPNRQMIWESLGVVLQGGTRVTPGMWLATWPIYQTPYEQEMISLQDILGEAKIGKPGTAYKVEMKNLRTGHTRIVTMGELSDAGTVMDSFTIKVKEPVYTLAPGYLVKAYYDYYMDIYGQWVDEPTSQFFLELICDEDAEDSHE